MILNTLLSKFESFLNQSLQMDEAALTKLKQLAGIYLAVTITDLNQTYLITFHEQRLGLQLLPPNHDTTDEPITQTIDISISATLLSYLSLLLAKDPLLARQLNINFTGNIETINQIQALFFQLDIDWEEHLAQVIGDPAAYQISKLAKLGKQELITGGSKFIEMLSEYILDEQRYCPTAAELADFNQAVDELRSRAARLEIQLALLQRRERAYHETT